MLFQWLKRFTPRGLYGRAALILLVPVVTIQLVVSVVFIQRHFEDVTRQMTGNLVLEVDYLIERVNAAPGLEPAREEVGRLIEPLTLSVDLPGAPVGGDARHFYDLSGRVVIATLRQGIEGIEGVDLQTNTRRVRMSVETTQGLMQVSFDRRRVSASNPHQLLVLMVLTSALMTIIAFLYLRNQLRPIKRLAAAAEAFGKGRTLAYRPSGASEVRAAGNAFLDMRGRIERQIEQRTLMLSGVSHDLRTPLTRLKLGLSMLDQDEEIEALKRDVADMERLVDEFLAFAREDALDDPVEIDPARLLDQIVQDAVRGGGDVRKGEVGPCDPMLLRPVAITRALENLIGNALRYGGMAEVSLITSDRALRFIVEDDGPGIPAEDRAEALKPFIRLDSSRNQNLGSGVGLGLSIAQDIARRHGGTLRLGDSIRLGGLRAELVIAR